MKNYSFQNPTLATLAETVKKTFQKPDKNRSLIPLTINSRWLVAPMLLRTQQIIAILKEIPQNSSGKLWLLLVKRNVNLERIIGEKNALMLMGL